MVNGLLVEHKGPVHACTVADLHSMRYSINIPLLPLNISCPIRHLVLAYAAPTRRV